MIEQKPDSDEGGVNGKQGNGILHAYNENSYFFFFFLNIRIRAKISYIFPKKFKMKSFTFLLYLFFILSGICAEVLYFQETMYMKCLAQSQHSKCSSNITAGIPTYVILIHFWKRVGKQNFLLQEQIFHYFK